MEQTRKMHREMLEYLDGVVGIDEPHVDTAFKGYTADDEEVKVTLRQYGPRQADLGVGYQVLLECGDKRAVGNAQATLNQALTAVDLKWRQLGIERWGDK